MALSQIAFIAPNFRDFKNYWLKAYEPGTTTPKIMALDSAGSVTVAKLELNKDGFLKSAGGALVIPYLSGAYDLFLFPTEAEADANDTSNAEQVADDISTTDDVIKNSLINDLSQAYEFPTVAAYKNFSTAFPVGKVIYLLDRDAEFTIITGSGTANTFNVISNTSVNQSIDLVINAIIFAKQIGAENTAGFDNTAVFNHALGLNKPIEWGVGTYEINGAVDLPNSAYVTGQGKQLTEFKLTDINSVIKSSGAKFNIVLKKFRVNGSGVADRGISLGVGGNISAHHVLSEMAIFGCKVINLELENSIYIRVDNTVYVQDSLGVGVSLLNTSLSTINCVAYNHALGSFIMTRGGYNTVKATLYNDVAFPSDFLMLLDATHSNRIKTSFEPQGNNNVRASLLLRDTQSGGNPNNCVDNDLTGCRFLGIGGTCSEASIIVGDDGPVYKTIIDKITAHKNTGLPSILLKNQSDTNISNSVDLVTYDTPVFEEISVQNDSGNAFYGTSLRNITFLPTSGFFNPELRGTGSTPTITYTTQSGRWNRVGNLIHVDIFIELGAYSGGVGAIEITGLPFKQAISYNARADLIVGEAIVLTVDRIVCRVAEGDNYIQLLKMTNTGLSALFTSEVDSGMKLRLTGTYIAEGA